MNKFWLGLGAFGAFTCLGAAMGVRDTPVRAIDKPIAAKVHAVPAISLTGSDGSGLELVSLRADAVVEDPLAFTELRLVFRNPEDRVREGRFRITLPPGATISRFAMRIDDRLQEGEVVEQQAARVAYEDFLHRRQDPALLEAEAGNEFSARVFPIPARATKELIVSYSQQLTRHDEPYALPLRGLPRLGTLSVRARVRGEVVQLDERDYLPDHDFEVANRGNTLGLRHDNLVAARIVPIADSPVRDDVTSLLVLIDTSASRALGLVEQLEQLEALLSRLGDTPVQVAAFDQSVSPLFQGRASEARLRDQVLARRALGASDLEGALAWSREALQKRAATRVLLVGDGVTTAGANEASALRAQVKALAAVGVERLDVLATGGIRDDVLLSRLVTAGLPRDGVVLDAARPSAGLHQKLTRATRSGIEVAVEGAGWVWPSVLDGVQPGDEVVVYADLPADRAFKLTVDGKPLATSGGLSTVERPLLERAWVKARIDRLVAQRDQQSSDRDLADALKAQAIELSTKYRVLSPFTSLLVLETEQDYARFHIERRALADILTVDAHGLTLLHRADVQPLRIATDVAQPELADKAVLVAPKDEGPAPEPAKKVAAEAPAASMAASFSSTGFGAGGGGVARRAAAPMRERAEEEARADDRGGARVAEGRVVAAAPKGKLEAPVTGELAVVLTLLKTDKTAALARALAWRSRDAGDVLALIALGESWEALGDSSSAERAYGSIIDLFPGRADLRRFAGERLERIQTAHALALAIDTYRKAVAQRPDHPASHRLLAFALLKQHQPRAAFDAILQGMKRDYPDGRFRGVERILREDLGLVAAAWAHQEPARADEITDKLTRAGGKLEQSPSLRFVLNWETDANDVDFHIEDARGGHAYYSDPHLASGGDLYADVTTGYGPECFTIRGAKRAYPYHLRAHYYSRGPMGYGMGKLQVIEHDGRGTLRFEERPFVVMEDGAYVELGAIAARGR